MKCHFKENNWYYLLPVIQFELSWGKWGFWKTWICHLELDSFQIFKETFMRLVVFKQVLLFILCNEMCQYLWDLHNFWINIFQMTTVQFYKIGHDKISKGKIHHWMDSEIKFTYYKIHPFKVYNSMHLSRYAELKRLWPEPRFRTFLLPQNESSFLFTVTLYPSAG